MYINLFINYINLKNMYDSLKNINRVNHNGCPNVLPW